MKKSLAIIIVIAISILVINLAGLVSNQPAKYLFFSDAAKFANIASNITTKNEYLTDFTFFSNDFSVPPREAFWVPRVTPIIISIFFKLFGISDSYVVLVSQIFFIISSVLVFLLAKKYFGKLVALLSSIAFCFNLDFINYANNGASELVLITEMLLTVYLLLNKKISTDVFAFIVMIIMYFTKAQSLVYILGFIFLYILLHATKKNFYKYMAVYAVMCIIALILVSRQGSFALFQIVPNHSSSDALRGMVVNTTYKEIIKKFLYNSYNLYKLLPQIASPYLWGLFIMNLMLWKKSKTYNSFKVTTILIILITFASASLTIPLFRYIHPIIPFVYIFAIDTLVWMIEKSFEKYRLIKNKQIRIIIIAFFIVFIFCVGQTLGVFFLDSRYNSKIVNKNKPPTYVLLSEKLKNATHSDEVVLTNLDTWGSWYGKRSTVWYPLEPDMIIPKNEKNNPFDAVFLTSYLINDENYYMGDEWRQIFYNPENIENDFIRENYQLKEIIEIPAEETYEKQAARAVLLVRK